MMLLFGIACLTIMVNKLMASRKGQFSKMYVELVQSNVNAPLRNLRLLIKMSLNVEEMLTDQPFGICESIRNSKGICQG